MKNIFISIITILLCGTAYADEPYFLAKKGAVIDYVNKSVKGEHIWDCRIEVIDINDNGVVMCIFHFKDEKGEYLKYRGNGPMPFMVYITKESIAINYSDIILYVFRGILGEKAKFKVDGERSILPNSLNTNDSLKNAYASISTLGVKFNININERKVLKYEELKSDIGNFDCVVIEERVQFKGFLANRTSITKTWYARGIGMVRQEKYNKRGKLEYVEVIKKITLPKD